MNIKHADGPWVIEHAPAEALVDHVLINSESHGALAQVVWKMEDDERSPRCEANALLIAAAPNMKADLEMALTEMTTLAARLAGSYRLNLLIACERIKVTLATTEVKA